MALVLKRIVPKIGVERANPFAAPTTGTTYYYQLEAEDGGLSDLFLLWGTGAPSTNYAEARIGSHYTDLSNGELYVKTAASTWTKQT